MTIKNNILTLTLVAKGFSSIKYTSKSNDDDSKGISWVQAVPRFCRYFSYCCGMSDNNDG
jgi:hypothetical protein